MPEVIGNYIPVSVATLVPARSIGVSLYMGDAPEGPMRLYRDSTYPFEAEDIRHLLDTGIQRLYVLAGEHLEYQNYLRTNLQDIVSDESLSAKKRFAVMNQVVRNVLAEGFQEKDVDKAIDTIKDLGHTTVDMICRQDAVASELFKVMYHDYHTFTHSANVAYYCVMLADALGIHNKGLLNQIAVGGLLHDLGKLEIPDAILTKPGRLTDEEFLIIQEHPTTGFVKLSHRSDLTLGQLMMTYQHHERLDGRGYPVGVTEKDLHPWSKICKVADVFEALTSTRPYRGKLPLNEVFEIMDRDIGTGFDESILECWKQIITKR